MPQILKRLAMGALVVCVLAAIGASPAVALHDHTGHARAKVVTHLGKKKPDQLCREASGVRKLVIKQFGKRAPGRDICKYGLNDGKPPPLYREVRYLQTLERMLAPPPQPVQHYSGSATAQPSQPAGVTTGGSGAVPGCASESGTNYSTGPTNTNPSSHATGRYQITPGTHAWLCADLGWSPSQQDQCAVRIYKVQGTGAWTGCGG